ncbi:MAG: CRISPR-associated protein Cas5 [Deferrisomatales bacterium]
MRGLGTERHRYTVELEVAGALAMFARPDTGGTPTSYPLPTWSAAKGIFESIAFLSDGAAWICPTKVEICCGVGGPGGRVRFQRYTTNYGGPLRKTDLFSKGTAPGGSSMQFFATALSDVCYRLHGAVVGPRSSDRVNARHYLKDLFDRRLRQGRCFRTPCLGWSEFTCSYWGPFRNGVTEVDDAMTLKVPSMLLCVWNHPVNPPTNPAEGRYAPEFRQDVEVGKVTGGVMEYDLPVAWLAEAGREGVADAQ